MPIPVPDPEFVDPRRLARSFYWRGWGVTQLVEELNENWRFGLKRSTVEAWKQRDKWDEAAPLNRVEEALDARLTTLIYKETKTPHDFKEIDLLMRQMERAARVRRYEGPGGNEADLNPNVANRNAGPKQKPAKNRIDEEAAGKLDEAFRAGLFRYQEDWRGSSSLRTRFILKSRQIGATWYFAREALIRALETGNNQIFISASRAQANIFRQYIVEFVFATTGIKLEGDPIVLDRGEGEDPVTLYFLGTNYKTAQGYHGDVYIDECFWIHGFEKLNKVASGMAMQARYRKTYFSTPSTRSHEAFKFWSGERFNAKRAKAEQRVFDVSHARLAKGELGPDGTWRQIVTIDDAQAGGCDLFDLDELRLEYSTDEFDNLLRCQFIDDSQSMFPYALLRRCMVDSWDAWKKDFDPYALRPFGDGEVWIGYDPQESANGDDGACVVIAPPTTIGGKFRCLEKFRWKGEDYQQQADRIQKLMERYNVQHVAIDGTGIGSAVWQLVRKFFPRAVKIQYSPVVKSQMVLKAKNVMTNNRLEFDAGWTDLAASFMAINPELTASQRQLTYVAKRSDNLGHADLAWAAMHAIFNEPLDSSEGRPRKSRVKVKQ